MNYPKYLSIGNWLFVHIETDFFIQKDKPVGDPIPENLYVDATGYHGISINLSKDLRTYEGLIAYGCTEPSDSELLRLIKSSH